jgi:TolA-binding protein
MTGIALVGIVGLLTGCNSNSQFQRLENEVNDLKVEIFRQRQVIQEIASKTEEGQRTATAERARDNQFRADTQETLRQISEHMRVQSNRMESGTQSRTTTQARQPVRPANPPAATPSNTDNAQPDEQQFAMANRDYNTGNFRGAVDAVDNLVNYFPDSERIPEALHLKGRALQMMRQFKEARDAFELLCNRFPRSELFRTARLDIGRCHVSEGNTLAAVAVFEDIIRRWPSSQEARLASEILQDVKVGR